MAKHLATILIGGFQVLGKAFVRALQNEIRASQQAAQSRAGTRSTTEGTATNAITGMTLKEAMDILNIKSLTDKEAIQNRFDHLFKMNDKSMGGTLYLQSKVVRAKERIEAEISSLEKEAKG